MRYLAACALFTAIGCSSSDPSVEGQRDASSSSDAASTDTTPAPDAEVGADDATTAGDAETADAGSADAETTDAGPSSLTFTADIFPMFETIGCSRVSCHGSLRAQGGTVVYLPDALTAYADLFERPSIREASLLIRPGDPQASVLFTHARDQNIPAGDMTEEGLALIGAWITDGAPYGADVVITPVPQPATCTLADHPGTPPLPDACMPRCTAETWAGVGDCRTQADVAGCQRTVIAADTSTVVQLDFGPDLGTLPVDCGTCLDLQTETCFVDHCLHEYLTFVRCRFLDQRPTACNAEVDSVIACSAASTGFRNCQGARDVLCVGP